MRAALRASRRAEERSRKEADRLREELENKDKELEALRTSNPNLNTQISDEELAQLDEDFPLQAKIVRQQRELEAKLKAVASAPAPQVSAEFEPAVYDAVIQDVIDTVPDLVAWQYDPAAQDKFNRAVGYDTALRVDPDWKDKTPAERFAEAARRVNAVAGAPAAAPTPAPSAASAARIDPAQAVANAPVAGPKGISDFQGGAPGHIPAPDYSKMSDEAIMGSLPVS